MSLGSSSIEGYDFSAKQGGASRNRNAALSSGGARRNLLREGRRQAQIKRGDAYNAGSTYSDFNEHFMRSSESGFGAGNQALEQVIRGRVRKSLKDRFSFLGLDWAAFMKEMAREEVYSSHYG